MYNVVKPMFKTNTFDKKTLKYKTTHLNCKKCSESSGIQDLERKFEELHCDKETSDFINNCYYSGYQLFKASYLRPWLNILFNNTDSNAILGTGKMFLLSKQHISKLFDNYTFKNMLDIGAGDGNVTELFQPIIRGSGITCTEASDQMRSVLKSKGFLIQDDISGEFELVACLNVLDRCSHPVSMLKEIFKVKKRYVILSIVLPFKGFYYAGKKQNKQEETLIGCYKEWEESVHRLCKEFISIGFNIVKISRLPYLSEGDFRQEMYVLDTAIFILS